MTDQNSPGKALRAWRDAEKLSQFKAGQRLALFNEEKRTASQNAWRSWEIGEKSPDLFFAFAIERMTLGKLKAERWARPPGPKAADSTTNITDDEALRGVG